jgi:orotidine-5'-phosphate decarboxylase
MPSLCAALDALEPAEALDLAKQLAPHVDLLKVGLGLYARGGPSLVSEIRDTGADVFLDLKLHDIPSQVGDAVSALCRLDVAMLTLHTAGGGAMLEEAASARGAAVRPALLGVSVLTSLDSETLRETGVDGDVPALVRARALLAKKSGLDGLVCSAADLATLGPDAEELAGLVLVTPGIRPSGADHGDQRRVVTPARAIELGADFLVVGRPITRAPDPVAAARALRAEMKAAS